ncbi:MAG: ABC transporter permease [Coprobacter sp.]|nr:ABC transporter permease [Coprobacter sp.]
MNNRTLIIQQEYLSRIKKKSFILMTLCAPILFAAVLLFPIWLQNAGDTAIRNIKVIDQTGLYKGVFSPTDNYTFSYTEDGISSEPFYAYLVISDNLLQNPNGIVLYSENPINADLKNTVEQIVNTHLSREKLAAYDIPDLQEIIDSSESHLRLTTVCIGKDGKETETSAETATLVGLLSTLAIYTFLLLYGSQVMRAVTQEKSNRIVEILVSSVKPFDLMMGKICAIGLVGLTQILIWILLFAGISGLAGLFFDIPAVAADPALSAGAAPPITDENIQAFLQTVASIPIAEFLICFLLFFIGGYMLYASLFAAIGSMVDQETDTQQFIAPVTVIIIIALYLGIFSAQSPDSAIAFWSSLFPLTSPIVMIVRIAFGVPVWQTVLSLLILFASSTGMTGVAGRIYRTGIMMYGKKASYRDILKWLTYKK